MKLVGAGVIAALALLCLYSVACYSTLFDTYAKPKMPEYIGPRFKTWKGGVLQP